MRICQHPISSGWIQSPNLYFYFLRDKENKIKKRYTKICQLLGGFYFYFYKNDWIID